MRAQTLDIAMLEPAYGRELHEHATASIERA